MKKILTLALALLMIVGCVATFASCGKKSDWEKVEKNGKFICGITIYAPMNYYDANGDLVADDSGDLIGFDTELARLVAQKLGVDVEFQVIDWGNKYAELQAGTIDCIWNGFTSNSKDSDGIERSEKVDFTYAYLDNKQCVVVKTDRLGEFTSAASLSGKKAGAENGSAGESYAQSAGATIEAAKSSQLAVFTDLNANTVDFIVVDKLLADEVVGKGDYANLSIVSAIDIDPEVYSIGCRKNSDLDEKINEALVELLNEGKVEELAAKYGVRVTDSFMAKKTAQ
ncbi:MAG: transporter substrate-binding domain-containing protein [Ruminococcaceae bacterium]|nr:transporter substrate-binding domain-containing protein [Oscillospiraceae bacterium]